MIRLLAALGLMGLVWVTRMMAPEPNVIADGTMAIGFVLVVSFMLGIGAKRLGLPSITGYLLCGVLFGPAVLSAIAEPLAILPKETVSHLQLLDNVVLGLIALTAGGELNIEALRPRVRALAWVLAAQVVIVLLPIAAFLYFGRGLFSELASLADREALAVALLLAVIAVAKSPSTTIAVIQEYKAEGPLTQLVVAVTVVKDVVVVIVFSLVMGVSSWLAGADADIAAAAGEVAWELVGSLVVGLVIGWMMTMYLRIVRVDAPLMVIITIFLTAAFAHEWHLSPLLMCMVAGFYVENFSRQGEALIHAIERHSLPLYVIFFTIAGATLDLGRLAESWMLALALVGLRLFWTYAATALGARIAGESVAVQKYSWTGFLGQAGVAIGFVAIIDKRLPEIASVLSSIVLASVAINQVIGPILFKYGLLQSGEARRPQGQGGFDEPTGLIEAPAQS